MVVEEHFVEVEEEEVLKIEVEILKVMVCGGYALGSGSIVSNEVHPMCIVPNA